MTKKFAQQLRALPKNPGVYQFVDRRGKLLYIGKAAALRDRVRSYFRTSADLSPAKAMLVERVAAVKTIEVASEIEALLLEAHLIKKHKPPFNVLMRDDKSYAYIKVSTEEEWPRVFATRKLDKAGTYFGPFTSVYAVHEVLRVLRKVIPYRCNQKPIDIATSPQSSPPRRGGFRPSPLRRGEGEVLPRACLWYHLGRCPGTCIGAISKTEYRKNIRRIVLFLEGKMDALKRALKKELGPERVALMENVLAHTRILSLGEKFAYDAVALARVLHLPRTPERIEGYDISNTMGREAVGAMVVFVNGEPEKSEYKKFKIKTVRGVDDPKMLEEVLMRRMRHSNSQYPISKSQTNSKLQIPNNKKWPTPDLIVVDGGKAQLNAAMRALQQWQQNILHYGPIGPKHKIENLRISIPVIAVAKGGHGGVLRQKEEIYFPGERASLKLPNASPALHLILRVRDEAHRFAIGYHRMLRRQKFLG